MLNNSSSFHKLQRLKQNILYSFLLQHKKGAVKIKPLCKLLCMNESNKHNKQIFYLCGNGK